MYPISCVWVCSRRWPESPGMKAGHFMPKKNILTFQGGRIFRCPHSIKRGQFSRAVFGDVKTIVRLRSEKTPAEVEAICLCPADHQTRGERACSRWGAKRPQQQRLHSSDVPRCQVWGCCAAQREQAPSPRGCCARRCDESFIFVGRIIGPETKHPTAF